MSIGKKIKELRRKNDLTQEKLADYLGVSYQAVSKWETDVSSPDLALIVPLARLFDVTTDELFGMDGENARRMEFDKAYENYWQKDIEQMYIIAQQAVSEFPGDYKYIDWLASMEFYKAFDDDYRSGGSKDYFDSMLAKARKHYDIVIEGCRESEIREKSLFGIILTLKYLGNLEEAKKYAELLPEKQGYSRDMLLELCTEGEEQLSIRQRIVYQKTSELLTALRNIWEYPEEESNCVRAAVDYSEKLIKMMVPDGNYYGFYWNLYQLYLKRAAISMVDNELDNAVNNLAIAKEYASKRDSYSTNGKCQYTCTIFDHVTDDISCEQLPNDSIDYWKSCVNQKLFDPLRDREDFKQLVADADNE
ncbi:MAG: helix-turn-helix transcriptional regulator [Clostridia bacterium]|nr:helix-turn-helix transcriptional regulator [Clostridia bacterium]